MSCLRPGYSTQPWREVLSLPTGNGPMARWFHCKPTGRPVSIGMIIPLMRRFPMWDNVLVSTMLRSSILRPMTTGVAIGENVVLQDATGFFSYSFRARWHFCFKKLLHLTSGSCNITLAPRKSLKWHRPYVASMKSLGVELSHLGKLVSIATTMRWERLSRANVLRNFACMVR